MIYKSRSILILFFPGSAFHLQLTKNHLQIEMEFAHKISKQR